MLNYNGIAAKECLLRIPDIYPWIKVDKYVVMPNHIHIVLVAEASYGQVSIANVIGQYKMAVTKIIRKMDTDRIVWQRSFHDHIIRNQKSYERIWNYIEDNPRKWEEDCFYME